MKNTGKIKKISIFLSALGLVALLSLIAGCDSESNKSKQAKQNTTTGGTTGGTGTQADENGVIVGGGQKSALWTTPSADAFYLRFTKIEGLKLLSYIPNIYQKNNVIEVPFPEGSTNFKVSIKGFSTKLNNQNITGVKIDNKSIPQNTTVGGLVEPVEVDLATPKDIQITTANGTTTYALKAVERDILEITEIAIVGISLTSKFNQGIFEYSITHNQTELQILARALNNSLFQSTEEYKVDNDNWKEFGGNVLKINLSVGKHKIYFRAKNDPKAPIYLVNLTITN